MSPHLRPTPLLATMALSLSISACSTVDKNTPNPSEQELASRMNALTQQETELQRRAEALEEKERKVQAKLTTIQNSETSKGGDVLPSYAKPGECYIRLWVPPKHKEVIQKMLVAEKSEKVEITAAKYKKVSKRVLVKEASTKIVSIPATYKTVTERVIIRPASEKPILIPATYETVEIQIIDKPATTEWKKGHGPIQRIDDTTGEILCLVDVPATYKTVSKRVIKTPTSTQFKTTPAVYKTIEKTVVDKPASSRTVEIPAEYKTIEFTELEEAAKITRSDIPEKHVNVTTQEVVTIGRMEWRSILCDVNTTRERIRDIQTALFDAGYDPGPIDGIIGVETMRAVNAYQRSNGLPVDSYLNIKTVKSLGVTAR